jgi:hypothetical protein
LFDSDGLRYATPPVIADYRAKRLKYDSIADISCGVGIQLISFSKYINNTIGVERDSFRAKLAELNMISLGTGKWSIITGDALDNKIMQNVDVDCIFSDPSRKPTEKRRRLDTLLPNPLRIYEVYKRENVAIVFELPPQISKKEVKINGEKEYTSLGFRLNRLALYTDNLAECNTSAITLPSEEKITDMMEKNMLKKSEKLCSFVYEIDNTIIKAGLLENFAGKIGFDGAQLSTEKKRELLTSDLEYQSYFLKKYVTRGVCSFNCTEINNILKRLKAQKAILRFYVKPEEYWRTRNKIEELLVGEKTYYVFKIHDKGIIAEQL